MINLELKVPPLLLMIAFAAVMFITDRTTSTAMFVTDPVANLLSGDTTIYRHLLVAGISIVSSVFILLGVHGFWRARTTVDPTAPQNANQLVVEGIYRVSRNPMYVGFFLLLVAWGLYLANSFSLVFAVLYVIYMNQYQIKPEERALARKFGPEYAQYKARVRRWI